ncbi:hypothetical protein H6G00_33270 [Leptolyngbya sp. FACHB-541]|uniref:hypothetical protein n=1 Tax=Leptolyngbya sp. FACHB-541 TaxID=2692810 RepID=UPI0016854CF1|nr:hypothetical protein [Leptolyngbya sp. FACHB-541]MBD2001412.1 hypothetical protein [Leptolyngbya sp. FACHB-541]
MGIDFFKHNETYRLQQYNPPDPLIDEPVETEEGGEGEKEANLDYETPRAKWEPIPLNMFSHWKTSEWENRPVRFVDGKDVGETVAWLCSPTGYPVPVRLSQIGSVVMRVVDGECRRDFHVVERVVSMASDLFPWDQVENLAIGLQAHGFRLLNALPDGNKPSDDFERMRKAADNKTMNEMTELEEAALAQNSDVPTVVDGRLEPRSEGFHHEDSPAFGVIKTPRKLYMHPQGVRMLYQQLEVGQRTPAFTLTYPTEHRRLPVITWFVRIAGGRAMPSWGFIRVEASLKWFQKHKLGEDFINHLSRTVYEYRCRESSYDRAPVSLHPIVRGEQSLGSLLIPMSTLKSQFYRLTGL